MFINLKAQQFKSSTTPEDTNSQTHQLTNEPTHKIKTSPTQMLINSLTHKLRNSPTQNLKSLSFILQLHSNFRSVLAKILAKK